MQYSDMSDKPDLGPIGELIHDIRYKKTAFKSCIGEPMTFSAGNINGGAWARE
jgi:hypothetical protein